jgi:hypothetical protein
MTIDEAIRHLEYLKSTVDLPEIGTLEKALLLGIEALKAYKELRTDGCYKCPGLLPGETEK